MSTRKNSKRKPLKKNNLPKDKLLKAIEGVRFRWSGDNLRRHSVLIVGSKILIPERVATGARKRWVELDSTEKVYRTRAEMNKELSREAEALYSWDGDKIEKIFRKSVPGGGVRYVPEDSEDGFGSYRYERMAKEGKLFKTRKQAVRHAVKSLRAEAAEKAKQAFNISKQANLIEKAR